MEGDLILQALNGFLLILTCEGEVFYASHTVETYLGFHQSDICHQSVYELVHSEDREELQRHLMWSSHLPADRTGSSLQEVLLPENAQSLERNFTVRFRCLLDNTSGFLRLDIRGRIKVLQGQNHKTEEPPMALFAVCTPFGPPSLLEMPQKDSMFKSKHKLDLSLVSMDQRGKQMLGYSDSEFANKGGYDLVHFDDLAYVASAHQELLKTGASGLIAYRLVTKDNKWQWLQTSARLVYKNSKPDFILCTHRPLMEEEGRDLLGKRTMDFKVTYLDGGLGAMTDRNSLLADSDFILRCQRNRRGPVPKTDYRTKRKGPGETTYLEDQASTYSNVYPYATADNMNGLAPYAAAAAAAVPQNLFSAIDNSRFLSPENFLHYRHLHGGYYSDYPQYASNGFLDVTSARSCFSYASTDTGQLAKDDKLYPCQLEKFNGDGRLVQPVAGMASAKPSCCEGYSTNQDTTPLRGCLMSATSAGIQPLLAPSLDREAKIMGAAELASACRSFGLQSDCILKKGSKDPRNNEPSMVFSNDTRQSVLMWGNSLQGRGGLSPPGASSPLLQAKYSPSSSVHGDCFSKVQDYKWGVAAPKSVSPHNSTSPASGKVAPSYASAYTSDLVAAAAAEGWHQVDALQGTWRPHLPSLG